MDILRFKKIPSRKHTLVSLGFLLLIFWLVALPITTIYADPLSSEELQNLLQNPNWVASYCSSTQSSQTPSSNQQSTISSVVDKYDLQSADIIKVGGDEIASYRADQAPKTPASTMKLIIADTLIRSGTSLNSRVKITSDMVYGSGYKAGDKPTLGDSLDQMLRVSSNTAANGIMHALGGFNDITSKAQAYGYKNTTIRAYYSDAGDAVNKSTISDQVDAMNHIFTAKGSGYSRAQKNLEYAAKNDNHYSVADDANKWAGTSQVAGNVAKLSNGGDDYIIGVYINESDSDALKNGDIKNATADLASTINEAGDDGADAADPNSGGSGAGQCCSSGSSDNPSDSSVTKSTSNGGFTLEKVVSFASEPVTSTWNISDDTVEQWFLKQAGAQAVISAFGINSGNIGAITKAVKGAGVSPVFFYLYAVNEGRGAGGWINHFSGDVAGGGVANAKRDAEYIVEYSKLNNPPGTLGGEPSDMPTAEAQKILDALPSGSIGKVYIPATSAVTAELEDLSGKTGDWSGKFGKPLSDSMQNIKTMGGDPLDGGAPVSAGGGCAADGGVTGEGIQKAINFAVAIAKNDGYGYDQDTRATGWEKWQSDPGCTSQCGNFDCSSLIAAAITAAGYVDTNPNFATGTEGDVLLQAGFKKVNVSTTTSKGLKPGDILVQADHTEMYIGNNKNVGAHISENGTAHNGKPGDQTGHEISVGAYYNDSWTAVYRASN